MTTRERKYLSVPRSRGVNELFGDLWARLSPDNMLALRMQTQLDFHCSTSHVLKCAGPLLSSLFYVLLFAFAWKLQPI